MSYTLDALDLLLLWFWGFSKFYFELSMNKPSKQVGGIKRKREKNLFDPFIYTPSKDKWKKSSIENVESWKNKKRAQWAVSFNFVQLILIFDKLVVCGCKGALMLLTNYLLIICYKHRLIMQPKYLNLIYIKVNFALTVFK